MRLALPAVAEMDAYISFTGHYFYGVPIKSTWRLPGSDRMYITPGRGVAFLSDPGTSCLLPGARGAGLLAGTWVGG